MLKKPCLRSKIWCCQWGPWSCRTCQRWCPAQCWLGLHVQQRQGEGEGEGFWQDCSWFAEPGVCLWHSLKLGRKLWACTRDHQRLLGGGGFASGAPAYTRAGAVEAELLSDNPQWSNSSKAMLRGGFKGETGQIPTWACEPHKDETASGCILPFDGFTTLYQRNERKTSMLIFGLTNPQPQEMWPGDQVWKCLQNQNLNVFSIHLILSASSVCANRLHRSNGEKSGLCKGFASWLWLLCEYMECMECSRQRK